MEFERRLTTYGFSVAKKNRAIWTPGKEYELTIRKPDASLIGNTYAKYCIFTAPNNTHYFSVGKKKREKYNLIIGENYVITVMDAEMVVT